MGYASTSLVLPRAPSAWGAAQKPLHWKTSGITATILDILSSHIALKHSTNTESGVDIYSGGNQTIAWAKTGLEPTDRSQESGQVLLGITPVVSLTIQ